MQQILQVQEDKLNYNAITIANQGIQGNSQNNGKTNKSTVTIDQCERNILW